MFGQPIEPVRAILHKAQHNVARITKPAPKSSRFMAMIEDDLRMTLAANFAAFRLGSDLSKFNAVTISVLHFLIAARKLCFPARIVLAMLGRTRERTFSAFTVTNEPWR